jgi:hypothetical protein
LGNIFGTLVVVAVVGAILIGGWSSGGSQIFLSMFGLVIAIGLGFGLLFAMVDALKDSTKR